MFRHIMVPTDGSALAERAIRAAMEVAKETGARVTGFYAVRPSKRYRFVEAVSFQPFVWREDVEREVQEQAGRVLRPVLVAAEEFHVACDTLYQLTEEPPYRAIIHAAERQGCDLIVMASHDREGIGPTLVGSEATKVLKHCHIPVLVLHEKPFMGSIDAGDPSRARADPSSPTGTSGQQQPDRSESGTDFRAGVERGSGDLLHS
jgi:nucleotide-binding universal stress UspA family protein